MPKLTLEVHREQEHLSIASSETDTVDITESINYLLKQDSTHTDTQSTHTEKIIQQKQKQLHIPFKEIKAAAIEKMVDKEEGITFLDILKLADNPTYTPKQAKDVLRNHKVKGNLITCNRTIPQQYYLSKADAEYSAAKSTHIGPTGVTTFQRAHNSGVGVSGGAGAYGATPAVENNNSTNNAVTLVDYQQANALYDRLLLLPTAPLSIHNIHLDFTLLDEGRESYDLLGLDFAAGVTINPHNKAKTLTRNLTKHRHIRYNLYPSGKTELLISCSKAPFPIQTDQDVTAFLGFIHQAQYILSLNLHDTTNSFYVPPVNKWRLTEVDVNRDVPCDASSLHIEPKLQLKMLDTTLRLYVKLLGGQSVLRLEEMRTLNGAFSTALASLRSELECDEKSNAKGRDSS